MTGLSDIHARAIIARGLNLDLVKSLGFHTVPTKSGDALAMPYLLGGKLHNTKLRRGKGDMPWTENGKRLIPWNIDCTKRKADPTEALIWTEGELDGVACLQVGFSRVVSVPNGAAINRGGDRKEDKGFQYLYSPGSQLTDPSLSPAIDQFQTFILATDGDLPGQALRDQLAQRLGPERCFWIEWPKGCKDANDVLKTHGPDELVRLITNPKRLWTDMVARMSDIPDEPPEEIYTLGHQILDTDLRLGGMRIPRVGFMTVSGPAFSGKSIFVRQLIWHLWRTYHASFALTSLEEKVKPRYQRDFRRFAIGKKINEWSEDDVVAADEEIDSAGVFIRRSPIPAERFDIPTLMGAIKFAVKCYGVRVVVIDPFNEVERDIDSRNQADEVGRFIIDLKAFADRFGVLVICIAHPPADVFRRKAPDHIWTLYDIEGSRHWAGKSDCGFMLWRPHPNGPTFCHVAKLKDSETYGKPDVIQFDHDAGINGFKVGGRGVSLLKDIRTHMAEGTWDHVDDGKPRTKDGWSPSGPRKAFVG